MTHPGPRVLTTTYTTVTWSDDGRSVTKVRDRAHDARRRFRYELQVATLLRDRPPPVTTPRLLAHDVGRRALHLEAVSGEPLGPKYATELADDDLDDVLDLVERLRPFDPRRRWLRRLDSGRRLDLAERHGLLTATEADALRTIARSVHRRRRFAHGDITPRNVLRDRETGELVLIDWEWAGLYPEGYELAFLWYSLIDVPGGRDRVEARTERPDAFLLSALLVTLWHLQWYLPGPFRQKHLDAKDLLVGRLLG